MHGRKKQLSLAMQPPEEQVKLRAMARQGMLMIDQLLLAKKVFCTRRSIAFTEAAPLYVAELTLCNQQVQQGCSNRNCGSNSKHISTHTNRTTEGPVVDEYNTEKENAAGQQEKKNPFIILSPAKRKVLLQQTRKVVQLHGEFSPLWNFRRLLIVEEIISLFVQGEGRLNSQRVSPNSKSNVSDACSASIASIEGLFATEDDLLRSALRTSAKSYCLWQMRRWLLKRRLHLCFYGSALFIAAHAMQKDGVCQSLDNIRLFFPSSPTEMEEILDSFFCLEQTRYHFQFVALDIPSDLRVATEEHLPELANDVRVQKATVLISRELDLCEEFLAADDRNFHVWTFRNEILRLLRPSLVLLSCILFPRIQALESKEQPCNSVKMTSADMARRIPEFFFSSRNLPTYTGPKSPPRRSDAWRSDNSVVSNIINHFDKLCAHEALKENNNNYTAWRLRMKFPLQFSREPLHATALSQLNGHEQSNSSHDVISPLPYLSHTVAREIINSLEVPDEEQWLQMHWLGEQLSLDPLPYDKIFHGAVWKTVWTETLRVYLFFGAPVSVTQRNSKVPALNHVQLVQHTDSKRYQLMETNHLPLAVEGAEDLHPEEQEPPVWAAIWCFDWSNSDSAATVAEFLVRMPIHKNLVETNSYVNSFNLAVFKEVGENIDSNVPSGSCSVSITDSSSDAADPEANGAKLVSSARKHFDLENAMNLLKIARTSFEVESNCCPAGARFLINMLDWIAMKTGKFSKEMESEVLQLFANLKVTDPARSRMYDDLRQLQFWNYAVFATEEDVTAMQTAEPRISASPDVRPADTWFGWARLFKKSSTLEVSACI